MNQPADHCRVPGCHEPSYPKTNRSFCYKHLLKYYKDHDKRLPNEEHLALLRATKRFYDEVTNPRL